MPLETPAEAGRRIDRLLAEYGASHRNPINKAIHWCAVPVISWAALAMLWSAPTPAVFHIAPFVNWATIVTFLVLLYYISLSLPLAVGMAVFGAVCFWLIIAYQANFAAPVWRFAAVLFAVAWVFQFIGHAVEGKRPSFFKDVQFLLIGPAWLMHFVLRRLGVPY